MTRSMALIAAIALTACDGSKRHASGNDIVVVDRNDNGVHADAVEPVITQKRQRPVVAPPPPSGLEAPPVVSGTFTDTPLPSELAHLNNLGVTPITTTSKPEERIP